MKYTLTFGSIGLVTIVMTGCSFNALRSTFTSGSASSSSSVFSDSSSSFDVSDLETVSYEGTLASVDDASPPEATYRLALGDGQYLFLKSTTDMVSYIGQQVKVTGTVRSTLDGSGRIMTVTDVTAADAQSSDQPLVGVTIGDVSSSSLTEVSSESSSLSALQVSSSSRVASKSSAARSSVVPPPPPVASSSVAVRPVENAQSSDSTPFMTRAKAMAKGGIDPAKWTQQYCSSHIGFCVPIHKNWWFKSFGATTADLWHVEASTEDILAVGDGPLAVKFVSGSLPSGVTDGMVVANGDSVTGYRSWTGKRHFEITAPGILKDAVGYMTVNLKTYEAAPQL